MIPGGRRWSQINPIQIHATAVCVASWDGGLLY
jgi:hypothetical protein